jgi:hypothetical protein
MGTSEKGNPVPSDNGTAGDFANQPWPDEEKDHGERKACSLSAVSLLCVVCSKCDQQLPGL